MDNLIETIKENSEDFVWAEFNEPIKITYKLRLEQMAPVELAELDDADLEEDHERLHNYYDEWLKGEHRSQEEGDWSYSDLLKAHLFVVEELKKRGKKCEFDDKLAKGVKGLVPVLKELQNKYEGFIIWEIDGEPVKIIIKGGEHSGHHGHAGRPGSVGGSAPSFGQLAFSFPADVEQDISEVRSWEGSRGIIGVEALSVDSWAYDVTIAREHGELVGVMAMRRDTYGLSAEGLKGKYSGLSYLATKRSGYGRQMMIQAAKAAETKNTGLFIGSAPGAVGFYEKLGMRPYPNIKNAFYWTPEDIIKMTGSKIMVNEPTDGVFTDITIFEELLKRISKETVVEED